MRFLIKIIINEDVHSNLHHKLHRLTKIQKNRPNISLTEVYRWGHLKKNGSLIKKMEIFNFFKIQKK